MVFIDSFQEKIWKDKYQYNDETYEQFCYRIADTIFKDDLKRRDQLVDLLENFRGLFGGRINSNIGIPEEGLTLFNCFIEALGENPDSLEGIMETVTNYAITLKSEGGVGFCADFFRPANTIIRKIGVTSPGAIKFLEIFDEISEVITSGNVNKNESFQGVPTKKSIRKGATMVTMSISHPDIEDFITAKSVPNKLTKMNMSVLVTDAFMECVKNDWDWDLWFPDINYENYEKEWNGVLTEWADKGLPIIIYKTLPARDLWDLILKSSYNRSEPGIIFIDNARKMDNLHYLEGGNIISCNPCSEVFGNTGTSFYKGELLPLGDVCCLGSINLTKYYDIGAKKFCANKMKEDIDLMVRALDNVIDISKYPLKMYEDAAKLKRKVGVGFMGLGSLMMIMNIRYGSAECADILDTILKEFINQAYKTSALLAKEKGPFELYSIELLKGGYVKNSGVLTIETIDLIRKYGLRNSAVTAIAPNGTLSIVAGNISGGLEPVFATEFTRWNRMEGRKVDFEYPKIHKGEWFETEYLKEDSVGDEKVLYSTDGKYRVDKNTGLCEKITIKDYGYKLGLEAGNTEFACAQELSIDEHLKVLEVVARNCDLSISKTINLPNNIPFEEFKKLYGKIHEYGIKGCTTYREGTSVAVLETQKKKQEKTIKEQQKEFLEVFKDQENDIIFDNVKLPDEYPARGYVLHGEGKKWYLHVAFKDKACTRPFAIFVNTNNREDNTLTFDVLEKLEEIARCKKIPDPFIEETKKKYAYQKNPVKICRMLGLLLRHNVDMLTIVKGLDELGAYVGTFVFQVKKFLSRFVPDHEVDGMACPNCGEKSIRFSEGCLSCFGCGYSRCG